MSVGDIFAALAIIGTVYSIFMQSRTGNIELAIKLRKEMQIDREEQRAEIARLDAELAKAHADSEKSNTEHAALVMELEARLDNAERALHLERSARGLIEHSLIEAQQRISALEDERDIHVAEIARKNARIAELEKISGTFPAVKP